MEVIERLRKELDECNRKLHLAASSREQALQTNFQTQVQAAHSLRQEIVAMQTTIDERNQALGHLKGNYDGLASAYENLKNISTQLRRAYDSQEKHLEQLTTYKDQLELNLHRIYKINIKC